MRRPTALSLVLVYTLLACAPATSPAAAPAPSPCADPRYIELANRDLDSLSEREYEYFQNRDRACTEYQRTVMATEPQRDAARNMDQLTTYLYMAPILGAILGAIFYMGAR